MSSTTVASRAYAVVPAKRSRWSRGGAYRPRSAPAAGSARHRADAGRRDRAARSPDPQPASCRRSFRRGYRARAAPSTRHHWRPRPDRQPVPGCVGRDVLAGACVPTSGPAGAVPVRVRSRSSAGLRWRRGRLWHPRRQHRPLRTGPGSGDRCEGRRFAPLARRIYVPGILSSEPSQVCLPAHGTVPERRANVQKGARPRGTDRRYSVPFRGSAGRRKDAGTRWLGCCPPEMSTGETHPRAKRPMNRAKTPLRRRAAPHSDPGVLRWLHAVSSLWRKSEIRTRPDRSRSVHWTAWRWARNRRLERLLDAGLVRGKTVGIDATALEANAAMRSIERRDTGESYEAFVRSLAEASGVETPTRADLARFDRSRKNKKTSNNEWKSPRGSAN